MQNQLFHLPGNRANCVRGRSQRRHYVYTGIHLQSVLNYLSIYLKLRRQLSRSEGKEGRDTLKFARASLHAASAEGS